MQCKATQRNVNFLQKRTIRHLEFVAKIVVTIWWFNSTVILFNHVISNNDIHPIEMNLFSPDTLHSIQPWKP